MFCALVYIPRKTHMPLHPIEKRCGENDSWNVSKWIRDALARLKGMFRWPPRAIRRQTVKTIRGLRELVNISFLCGDKKLQRVSSSAVSLMKPVKADRIREKKKKSDDWQCYGWAVKLSNHFFFLCLFLLIWDKRGRRGGVLTTLKHRYNTIQRCFVSLGVSAGLFPINLSFALAESLLICSWSPPTLSVC